jgi:hypothetical protein
MISWRQANAVVVVDEVVDLCGDSGEFGWVKGGICVCLSNVLHSSGVGQRSETQVDSAT